MPIATPKIADKTDSRHQVRPRTPRMYNVILFNDDFTTKTFVVDVLVSVFHKSLASAAVLMWKIHRQGSGVAGRYPRDIAETKVRDVLSRARDQGFPLKVEIAPEQP